MNNCLGLAMVIALVWPVNVTAAQTLLTSDMPLNNPCASLSDAAAKEFVVANVHDGAAIAARMITRSCEDQPLYVHGQPVYEGSNKFWGGYVDTLTYSGSVALAVESYVTYQRASDSSSPALLSSWVGIGGVLGTGALAQAGVYNTAPAVTWYELYPNEPAHATGVYPQAGDQMLVLVQWNASNGQYYFLEDDTTTGYYSALYRSFTPDNTTAEWITESSINGTVPTCSPISFSSANWSDQFGNWWIINPHGSADSYTQVDPAGGAVTPSSISNSNTFTNMMS
jgi:peptidase A4-like protein